MTSAMPKRQDIDVQETWDTSLIYPSDQAFQTALSDYKTRVKAFEANYKGKLSTVDLIIAALKEYEAILAVQSNLSHYAFLNLDVDKMNTKLATIANQFENVHAEVYPSLAFLSTELGLQELNF